MRLIAALATVAGGLVAIWAVNAAHDPSGPRGLPPTASVDRIAYVTGQGEIVTAGRDGSSPRSLGLSGKRSQPWPTWSPDGQSIAVSSLVHGDRPRIELVSADPLTGSVTILGTLGMEYAGSPGGGFREEPFHYPIWSPSGRHIALVTGTGRETTLTLYDRLLEEPGRTLVAGSSLWPSWSADSGHLLIHTHQDIILVDVGAESAGGDYRTNAMAALAERHRVAPWSGDGSFAFVERDGGGDHVVVLATADGARRRLDRAPFDHSALSWSPDGRLLAVHFAGETKQFMGREIRQGEGFRIYEAAGAPTDLGVGGTVLAMFWAPGGDRIAYVTGPDPRGVLSWHLYDLAENRSRKLVDFVPSAPQLALFASFDLFAISHSPWTHDGRSLVFSGRLTPIPGADPGEGADQVLVLGVDGPDKPAAVAEGVLAIPSPR